uniref:Uncharacterized protein n=1 Tax=viral metagenome TaxID=1070528 RepID=A0A6M3JRP7_9ZZZZ
MIGGRLWDDLICVWRRDLGRTKFKIPKNKAIVMAKSSRGECRHVVSGAIKSFCKDKNICLTIAQKESLSKRIIGQLQETFARLYSDKIILDWLCSNRIDLNRLNGGLRSKVSELMDIQMEK